LYRERRERESAAKRLGERNQDPTLWVWIL
jgi:hypothetical protein